MSWSESSSSSSSSKCSWWWSFLKKNLPDAYHPAARQPTPLNCNRYILLLFYMIYTFVTSCIYFNWASMSQILFFSEAFIWECHRDYKGVYVPNLKETEGKIYVCDKQESAVQFLFTLTVACHFTMAAFAGVILDYFGMKLTACLGQFFNTLAWLLLAFSSSSFKAYYPAFVFIGLGADTASLPTLLISSLFPGSSAMIITLIGAAASGSFGVPLVLVKIYLSSSKISMKSLCLAYACFGCIGCGLLIAIFFFPLHSFRGVDEFEEHHGRSSSSMEKKGSKEKEKKREEEEEIELKTLENNNNTSIKIEPNSNTKWDDEVFTNKNQINFNQKLSKESMILRHQHCVDEGGEGEEEFEYERKGEGEDEDLKIIGNFRVRSSETSYSIWSQLVSKYFFGICMYFVIVGLSILYFQMGASNRFFSRSVIEVMTILVPLSFIPCIILGKVVDFIGIMPVMFIGNTCGVLTYFFSCFTSDIMGYFSVFFNSIFISIFASQMYIYVGDTFDTRHFGKIAGIITMVGGLLSMSGYFFYDKITVDLLNKDKVPLCVAFTITLILSYVLLGFMYKWKKKNPRPFAPRGFKHFNSVSSIVAVESEKFDSKETINL